MSKPFGNDPITEIISGMSSLNMGPEPISHDEEDFYLRLAKKYKENKK